MNDDPAANFNQADRSDEKAIPLATISSVAPITPTAPAQPQTLRDSVAQAMANYFRHLDGQPVTDVYNMVLAEVEAPLLEEVLRYTRNNQTKASTLLGLNRGTLRKKLKQYDLL